MADDEAQRQQELAAQRERDRRAIELERLREYERAKREGTK